jgi:MoaA/NifB/PqqE/SkfB family radical SAM enzyme
VSFSNQSAEYFTLFPHAQLVRGARAIAVHDLFRSRVFWFRDASVAEALVRMVMGDRTEDAAQRAGISTDVLDKYLSVLSELDLGTRVEHCTISEAFRPSLTRSQAREKGVFQSDGKVTLELTNECVYRCPWCTTTNPLTMRACSCGVWPAEGERLSLQDRIFAIERLREQGKSKLVIQGGEPLLEWDELLAVVRAGSRLGMSCEIHSTGILLDQVRIEALRGHKVHFVLLLAAATESEFDAAVGRRGAWHNLHRLIMLLRQGGIPFSAKVPLSIAAATERRTELTEWAFSLGASMVDFLIYAPLGESFAWEDLRAASGSSSPQGMAVGPTEFLQNTQCHKCFHNACFIGADGRVTPCIGIREPLANLRETSMIQVLCEDRLALPQESTARRQVGACARCEFRFGCWACLVRTKDFRGTAARHWNCQYEPETATWIRSQMSALQSDKAVLSHS